MGWVRGETLGKGGFGFVSIAKTMQDHNLPPLIAVKSAKFSESESLKKEKELLDKFQSCPSILRCFGDEITTENGEKLYNILLEYASGGCLVDHIIIKGLPEITVSRCTKSILMALIHIHKAGYVHCDVKPHNVLLVGQDAKLADLGSCCKTSFDGNSRCDDFRGTVMYAAPESIAQQKYLPESDVWALGCSVLQMLTGKSPWAFDSKAQPKDVLFKIGCSDQIPQIPTNNRISKEAKDFLAKCLVKDPTARWKPDMLLDHPFVNRADRPTIAGKYHHHHHHHHRLSHGIHSLVPHCFHHPKVQAC
ncbi:mitogen-activated protein kinase kinase kinase 20 [Striga hermonthica]|uniref:Mitogen-activated protein kinase kinase kinase 20 n=1 Tax=Striga hermonthica TaxID=68872 RepID=A0A9N7MSR5_STRHE|nr:mitogen-activated protein kinase kinase kinase 20 [Striga hermonthica]